METLTEEQRRHIVARFYVDHNEKKKSFTVKHFVEMGMSRSTVYSILQRMDEGIPTERRSQNKDYCTKMDKKKVARLNNLVKNKTGVSQRKLAGKFGVDQRTIGRNLKKHGIVYRKRKTVPKVSPEQKERQKTRLRKFDNEIFRNFSIENLVVDDESYFTLDGVSMPGNVGYYRKGVGQEGDAPPEVRYKTKAKFPTRILVWAAISAKGVSHIVVCKKNHTINGPLYRDILQNHLLSYLDSFWDTRQDVLFWPDLASAHYSSVVLEWLEEHKIPFIKKEENPPNTPQIRPIEQFWGLLKQRVYAGNWSAKNTDHLAQRIRTKAREIEPEVFAKLFQGLRAKIRLGARKGLEFVL